MLLVLLFAASSEAVTLGRLRGTAVVGRSLAVTVQLQLEPEESLSDICPEVELYLGDSRLDADRIRVEVEGGAVAQTANIRVLSDVLVDEPILTLVIQAGCVRKSQRRFVLLTEPPGDTVPVPPGVAAVPAVPSINIAQTTATGLTDVLVPAAIDVNIAGRDGARSGQQAVVVTSAVANHVRSPPATAPFAGKTAPARATQSLSESTASLRASIASKPGGGVAQSGGSGQARLKLDAMDLPVDRVRLPDIQAPDDEAIHDKQRVRALETELKALLDLAIKNEQNLAELRVRLEQAESGRVSRYLVHAMLALFVLSSTMVCALWFRPKWFDRIRYHGTTDDNDPPTRRDRTPPAPKESASALAVSHAESLDRASVEVVELGSGPMPLPGSGDAIPSAYASLRSQSGPSPGESAVGTVLDLDLGVSSGRS